MNRHRRRRVSVALVPALIVVALAVGGAASTRSQRSGTLILFSVEWDTGVTNPSETPDEVCGVAPGGRTYRLTKSDIGALSADGALSPDGTKLAYSQLDPYVPGIAVLALPSRQPLGRVDNGGEATWSPDGSRLSFVSPLPNYAGGLRPHLWLAAPDGSGRVRLTKGAGEDDHPSWSPKGARLAFASTRSGRWQIYTVAANGRSLRNVTRSKTEDAAPDWSPNGRAIVFAARGSAKVKFEDAQIEVIGATGGDRRAVGKASGVSPVWSPDGREIAYLKNSSVHTVKANGTHDHIVFRLLALDDFRLDWAAVPDLDRLAPLEACHAA
jgi:dipeptidyl aminopeptidase/acylaminoacyl peptidase